MVKVKNLNNTSDKEPKGYDTWLEFWEARLARKLIIVEQLIVTSKAEVTLLAPMSRKLMLVMTVTT